MRHWFFLLLCAVGTDLAEGQLFFDDFTRGTDPGPLTPWVSEEGNWTVTGGALRGGANDLNSFAFAYLTNNWTDYSVQARIRFSSTSADAGGIGGRLNPYSGGHYAAWVRPEGSPGGGNTLQLVKFQYWLGFEYTNTTFQPMQTVSLPGVGTNWHTLKLAFQGNRIAVYYDSNLVANVVDVESNPFRSGGPVVSMSTASTAYTMFVDDFTVTALPTLLMAVNDTYFVSQNGSLTVPAPGVLSNDTPGSSTNLSAVRLTNPSRGTLTFNTNGSFTYVPSNNFVGVDSFTYAASDGTSNSLAATVAIDVTPSTNIFFDNFTRTGTGNSFAPWVVGLGEWNITGGVMLGAGTIQDYYSDTYIPGVVGDFTIQTRFQLPTGAWACGLSGRVDPVTGARYVANVYPEGSPLGPTPALRLIKFHSWGTWSSTYTAMALVSLPSVHTSYHTLKLAFYGNTIDVYFDGSLVVHAIDNGVDGLPLYRSGAFGAHMYMNSPYQATFDDLSVSALPPFNLPPVLPAQTNVTIAPLSTLTVTNTATDLDIPTNTLTYTLTGPAGATIDSNGVITWTPTPAQNLTTNVFTTVVTDFCPGATNALHLSATNSFSVVVNNPSAPTVVVDSTAVASESCAPTNNAIDPGEAVTVLFALRNTGAGSTTNLVATLLGTGGVSSPSGPQNYGALVGGGAAVSQPFSFTATGGCGSNITASLQLQDGATSLGIASVALLLGQMTTIFTQNFDSVTAPALPSGWTTSATGVQSNWVTQAATNNTPPNAAFSPAPANIGVNELVSPALVLPAGTSQLSFAHLYDLETNANNASEGFDGGVLEIKIGTNAFADILAAGGSFITNGYTHTISTNWGNPLGGRQAWSGTSGGFITTRANLPAAAAGQSVQLRWRCGTDNSNAKSGWRIDSIGTAGRVCCLGATNTAPTLPAQTNRTIVELTTMIVTNTATDPTTPPGGLSYSLLNPPNGAAISTNGVITWTPTEAQAPSTNAITTVVTDNGVPPLSATNSFTVTVNEINTAPVLPSQTNVTISELTALVVTNRATDTDIPANTLSYVLQNPPTGATIDTNGVINWTPTEAQGPSTNTITTIVTDNGAPPLRATNSFSVVVTEVNSAPVLPAQTNYTISELTALVVTNRATDPDIPANSLSYTLLNPPTGATIDTNGVINWTPMEAQGPSTNTIKTVVTDNGVPPLSATNSFTVVVNEVNSAPVLPFQTNRTIVGLAVLSVTNTASDSDLPVNSLSYSFLTAPTNAALSTNGVITWTPLVAQVPSTNVIMTMVTDYNPWASNAQHLSATNSFSVVVSAVHNGPALAAQPDRTISEMTPLTVTNAAADSDIPALALTYQLVNAPAAATIDTNGVIQWLPGEVDGPSTNTITTVVNDSGTPSLKATNTFVVVVNEVNRPPILPQQINRTIVGLAALTVTNTATDPDLPANSLSYALLTSPSNAVIDTNGLIHWTPGASQVPSTNVFETVVTDFNPWAINTQHLTATNSFTVVVDVVHNGPTLAALPDVTVNELVTLAVTNSASDSDLPALALTYELVNPPAGALIDTNGVITWTPGEADGPGTNTITTVVTDSGTPALSATNNFTVVVNEVNRAPVLPAQTNWTINGLATLTVTNTATDADLPANTLTYTLLTAPTNAAIDTNGVIRWTPAISQVPSTNLFETVVTDFNPWAATEQNLSATNNFTVVVNPIHNPPVLPLQTNRTMLEQTTLVVTNTATEDDVPPLRLAYELLAGPAGAAIDTNGVITWTPPEVQGPTTNVITTVVSDDPLGSGFSATNSFLVYVEVASTTNPPVIQSISVSDGAATISWSALAGHTYRLQYKDELGATDWVDLLPDVPASGPTASATNSVEGSNHRFYRVLLLP